LFGFEGTQLTRNYWLKDTGEYGKMNILQNMFFENCTEESKIKFLSK
jgi:hypothetical protein